MQKKRAEPAQSHPRRRKKEECRMQKYRSKPHQCDIKATLERRQKEECRMMKGRAKKPKAPKATPKRVDSQPIGTPMRPQSHPKAPPKPPQGSTKATSMRPQSHHKAKAESRK